jgi:hypothetical protein
MWGETGESSAAGLVYLVRFFRERIHLWLAKQSEIWVELLVMYSREEDTCTPYVEEWWRQRPWNGINFCSRTGWPDELVKKSPKVKQSPFLSKLKHNFNRGKKLPKKFGLLFGTFKQMAIIGKHSLNRRKFAKSGHPVQGPCVFTFCPNALCPNHLHRQIYTIQDFRT